MHLASGWFQPNQNPLEEVNVQGLGPCSDEPLPVHFAMWGLVKQRQTTQLTLDSQGRVSIMKKPSASVKSVTIYTRVHCNEIIPGSNMEINMRNADFGKFILLLVEYQGQALHSQSHFIVGSFLCWRLIGDGATRCRGINLSILMQVNI